MHPYLTSSHSWRRLILVLLVLCATGNMIPTAATRLTAATAAPAAPTIMVPAAANGRLLAPHQTVSLTVQVTGGRGAPLSHTAVTFLAPAGMGGHFGGKFFAQIVTDRRGMATARFTTGSGRAAYLVDALIAGTTAATSFAITVEAHTPMPPLGAAPARLTAQAALHLGNARATAQLYGPVLLEPGTLLGIPTSTTPQQRYVPTTIKQRSWLLWADDLPGSGFAHPTRFVLLPAGSTHPIARITRQRWWPVLLLPQARRTIDLRPANVTTRVIGMPLRAVAAAISAADVRDSCAIVIRGDTDWAFEDEANRMSASLDKHGFHVFATPGNRAATASDLESLIRRVRNMPDCKHLVLYIASHGFNDIPGFGGVVVQDAPNNWRNHYGNVYYWEIADLLRPLAEGGVQITLIVDACYSGSAISAMDDQGVPATVVTSADAIHVSYYHSWWQTVINGGSQGGLYTLAFLQAMENPNAHAFHGGMLDAGAAHAWVKAHATAQHLAGPNPQAAHTSSHPPVPLVTVNVAISAVGDTVAWTIKRPPDMPLDSFVTLDLTIGDTSKATFKGGEQHITVYLEPGQTAVQVPITGENPGATTVTVDAHSVEAPGRPHHGTSTIVIGSGVEAPNVKLHVGQTVKSALKLTGAMAQYLNQGTYPGALVVLEGYDHGVTTVRGFADNRDRLHIERPNSGGMLVITGNHVGKTMVTASVSMPRFPDSTLVVTGTFTVEVVDDETVTTGITETTSSTPTVPVTPTTGATSGEVIPTPDGLEFQAVVGGDIDAQGFSLSNSSTSPVTITSILIPHGYSLSDTSTCHAGVVLPGGMLCIGHIWFTPTTEGDYPGRLEVTYVRADGSEGTATIELDGHARGNVATSTNTPTINDTSPLTATFFPYTDTPTATATPVPPPGDTATATPSHTPKRVAIGLSSDELRFGYVRVGTSSAPQSVILTNTGDATVQVSTLQVVGEQRADFTIGSSACDTIAPGQSCTVPVTYSPSAPGLASAGLQFTDNASDSPQMVALSGAGIVPPSVTGSHVDMGTVILGQTETVTVTVENVGEVPITVGTFDIGGANLSIAANSCAGATLSPGGSCTMTLHVVGMALGRFSDSVSLGTTPAGGLQPIDVTGDVIAVLV